MSSSEIAKTIKRYVVLSIRILYRSVCNHPILISFSVLLLLLYQFFPSLFLFLLSTSPVLVCTTLLLGLILSYGQPNIPQIEQEEDESEKEKTTDSNHISSFRASAGTNNIILKHDEISAVQNTYEYQKPEITERELEEVSFTQQAVTFSPKNDTLPQDAIQEKESVISDERSLSIEREIGESSLIFSSNPALEEPIDSPHWQKIDSQDGSSGFESDGAESSSPDASMTDIIPLLEEIDPLLDPDSSPHRIKNPDDDSDSSSQASSHDLIQVESADEEEEDQSAKKGDESHESAFTWTADDQKNLMDLGYSEAERNRRLENLMARRRSRKNIRFELDRNLINLDGNTTGFSTISAAIDDLSQFRVHVPPISMQRENPFDSSFGLEDNPVPGSAPSVLAPRRNPFDEPYEEPTESMILTRESWSPRQYMSASHREMLFTRHDSFNYSSSEFGQGKRVSRFKPFHESDSATGTMEEGSSSNIGTFERQFSGNNGKQLVSLIESDSSSYGVDAILGSNPVRHDEERGEDEESISSDGSISSDDVSSVAVQLDNSEFESNGGREMPSIPSGYFTSSEKVGMVDSVPDLLVWDDVSADDSPGASSSSQPPSRELGSTPSDFGDNCKPVESNATPLASEHITNPSQENTIKTSQFSLMDLHPIPEGETGEDKEPDEATQALLGPLESDRDSDEDAYQIYPEPVEYNEIDENLLTELDAVGDFAPRQQISGLEFLTSVESGHQISGSLNVVIEPGTRSVLLPNENPEQTVYNPRRHILQSTSTEINALLNGIPDESFTVVNANQSGEQEQSEMLVLGREVAESEIPGIVEETESGMLAVKVKSLADLESAFVQVATSLAEGEDTGVVDGTESGMLVSKAKSIVDINTASEQVQDVSGGSTEAQIRDAEMGMVVLEAKNVDDIESAMMQISGFTANEDVGLVDETESGMLVVKASSKEDIDLVFKQVGEVIGTSDTVGENAVFPEDANSDMLVIDAKSINDIDSVMLNVSEVLEESSNIEVGDAGLVDETDSGMLVVKEKSMADLESVFKQVGEILRIPENEDAGTAQHSGDSENGMVALDARSLNDIDSAILNASEDTGSGHTGLVDETESGMLVVKANSLADINSVFKQVGEVLGKSDTRSGSPKLVEDANSGFMVLDARSIEDIDSAIMQAAEVTDTGGTVLVDETESGMLVVKASSVADIDSVFQQVGEVLQNTNSERENMGIVEDSHSGMLVVNAKSVNDIESAMLQTSEAMGNIETGLVDETDSGMLVVKASSVADINSVFQQVGEVLGKRNEGSENPGIVEYSDSGMLVLDAKSVEDMDSAILHVSDNCGDGVVDINIAISSVKEVGDSKVATDLPVVNGSNMENE